LNQLLYGIIPARVSGSACAGMASAGRSRAMSVASVEITCKGLFALLREDVEDLLFTKNRESRQAVSGRIIKRIHQINVVAEAEEIPREPALVRDATQTVDDLRQGLQKLENVLLGQSLRRHNLHQASAGKSSNDKLPPLAGRAAKGGSSQ